MNHKMDRHLLTQGFPVLYECFGCAKLFSKNHKCEAITETCSDCNKTGHYSGFCKQWKLPKLRLPRVETNSTSTILQQILKDAPEKRNICDPMQDDTESNNQQEACNPILHQDEDISNNKCNINYAFGDSNSIASFIKSSLAESLNEDGENLAKQDKNQNIRVVQFTGRTNKDKDNSVNSKEPDLRVKLRSSRKRSLDIDEYQENEWNDPPCEEELNYYKNLSTSLREQNSVLSQKHDTLRIELNELKQSLSDEQKQAEKYQSKLKMYRNASLGKTLDRLKEQTDRSNKRSKELEEQRKQLYLYVKKVEVHAKKTHTRVKDLVKEYEVIAKLLYPRYPRELIPAYTGQCPNCRSPKRHLALHCVAQGVTCQNCLRKNHLTAVCNHYDSLTFLPTHHEKDLLRIVARDIYQ